MNLLTLGPTQDLTPLLLSLTLFSYFFKDWLNNPWHQLYRTLHITFTQLLTVLRVPKLCHLGTICSQKCLFWVHIKTTLSWVHHNMLEFIKDPFLILHFFYQTLMTFLMMLFVILLSMLMTLHSTLNVIRDMVGGNN